MTLLALPYCLLFLYILIFYKYIFLYLQENLTYVPLTKNFMDLIWLPDAHIHNFQSIKRRSLLSDFELLSVVSEANKTKMIYIAELEVVIYCPMNFESYPLDKHICYFTLGSLTSLATSNQNFTLGVLNFEPSAQVTALDYYVQVNELPYSKQIKVDGGIVKQRTGFEIQLDRNIMSYLIDYYIPSGILVVASWVMSNIY